jgi:hypothetical protein
MQTAQPIFVHAWWRSGSTYVWSKLRKHRSLSCFFEPLNPSIADLTLTGVSESPDIADSRNLRHPDLTKHYFSEYADLIRSGRVRYSRELAYDRYLLLPDQIDQLLYDHIQSLISEATSAQRRAMLCFCRSQMRSAWMRQTFGGIHVAQIRNPADQWSSFKSFQSEIRPNFAVDMIIVALKLRDLHPQAFTHVDPFEHFAQQLAKRRSLPTELIREYFLVPFVRQRDCFDIFMVIWIASALQAIAYSDFLLDIDRLSTDLNYRSTASRWFDSIGCPIDFADCCSPISAAGREAETTAELAARAIRTNASSLVVTKPDVVEKQLPAVTMLSRQVLKSALKNY